MEQSRRHAVIASLLQVGHLVVCVNKMDLVGYDEAVFDRIRAEFTEFAAKLDFADLTFVPISALHGDNVTNRSEPMDWFKGPTLLWHLENVYVGSDRNLIDARFPVQYVIRPMSNEHHDYRGFAGQVAGGIFRVGDEVMLLPSGFTSRVAGIDLANQPLDEAFATQSVTIRLEDDLDISRGDMICRPTNSPTVSQDIDAMVCWFGERPMSPRATYAIKHTTRTTRAMVKELRYRLDVNTLHRDDGASQLAMNDIGRVTFRTTTPLFFDGYRRNRTTGSFIVIDEATNNTVGAAMIVGGP
jgi:bifunctional enzyme CysN/CysC